MSLNAIKLPLVKVTDPRVAIAESDRRYAIFKGPQESTYQPFPSTSFTPSQIQWSANPPSRSTIVNREAYVQHQYTINFAATGTGGAPAGTTVLNVGVDDAPRAYPIAAVTNTFQVTLNNDQVSVNLNQYHTALFRYNNNELQRNLDYSITPSYLDQFQDYNSGRLSNRNPLGTYGDSASNEVMRGGFAGLQVISNGSIAAGASATAQVILTVTEPFWLSPFLFGQHNYEASGLIGIQNISVTQTLLSSGSVPLARVWSHNPNTPNVASWNITSVSLSSPPSLLFSYLTPDMTVPIPMAVSYPYFEIVSYPTTDGSVLNAGASRVLTMNSVQLKTIPDTMYIYARQRDADLTVSSSDVFAVINNVTLSFNNRVGLLSTATQQDLYNISRKNGCNMNWSMWSQQCGSVLKIKFGEDVGLLPNESSGLVGNYQFAMQVNITNTSLNPITYQLMAVVVNEGAFNCIDGSCNHMVGLISSLDVLNANMLPSIPYRRAKHVYGGSFWDNVRNFASKAISGLKKARDFVAPVVSPALDIVSSAVPAQYQMPFRLARSVSGLGVSSGGKRKMKKKVKRRAGVLVGAGDFDGGRMLQREELKRSLRKHLRD